MFYRKSTVAKVIEATVFLFLVILFPSCKKNNHPVNKIVIWTDNSEFAQYIELFNITHKSDNAILVYKDNPALHLPPAKDEEVPDIVVGSWLRSSATKKYFKSLDYLFDRQLISSSIFYPQLVEAGKNHKAQIFLPVSFNIPAVVFDKNNTNLIDDSYTLSMLKIREIGGQYNQKKQNGSYTRIGFTPLSNVDFLYLATKIYGASFHEEKGSINWNIYGLNSTVEDIREWIINENTSAQTEQDFTFKYLFMPYYRQVTSGRTLFAYTTSDQLFKDIKDQNLNIDYRWIEEGKYLPIEDNFMMLGIYGKCQNQIGATEFVQWFFQSETQQKILERKARLNLETEKFGIAGGFSSVRDVTEHILPTYYTQLLTNLPPAQMLVVPEVLPARWESYKTLVVEPYLETAISSEEAQSTISIPELEKEWRKKVFD